MDVVQGSDHKSVNAKIGTPKAKHKMYGSCGERPIYYDWEKQVS